MKFTARIILVMCLIILLIIMYLSNMNENFSNLSNINDDSQNMLNIQKLKSIDKQDNGKLDVKILSSNPIYEKLNKYIKRYNINSIYNLENLDLNLPLVITYDNQSIKNEKNESFINFLKGLNHYKYNFIVCGINAKWDGWYGRYKTYLELLENIPSEQLVFVTDSRDVLVNDSPSEFVKNYNLITKIYNDNEKNKIIFGTEIGCCVNQMWHYSPGSVFSNINQPNIIKIKDSIIKNIIEEKIKTNFIPNNKIKITDHLDKIEINENKSEYNFNFTYSLERDSNIFLNGKNYPWEHWIKWNNFFKEKFIEATNKYKLLNMSNDDYPIIKLNFGMMVGTNFNIVKMLKLFDLRAGEDDQHLASEFFYMRPEMVILDYTQILLSNTGYKHSFRKCTSKTMNNNHYNINFNDHLNDHDEYIDMNVYTREDIPEQGIMYGFDIQYLKYFFTFDNIISYPCFIQSPGKDWNCYNELLYRFPYCDEKMCSYYYNLEQTQKYNIRDIIIHEYKNQQGDMKIEWIIANVYNPLYWALNLYIVKDIFDVTQTDTSDTFDKSNTSTNKSTNKSTNTETNTKTNINLNSDTFMLIDSGNLLGYNRFKDLESQHVMPWDDDFDLGWYSKSKFSKEQIENFFKQMIKKGYVIFIYYKEIYTKYSPSEKEHFTIRLNSENILQISNLLSRYEIVLFNIAISTNKYKEILKIFNMNVDFEEKYIDGTIKIPSVDIFMYEFNTHTKSYEYNKLFGIGYTISFSENLITPVKEIVYNKLKVKIPNNTDKVLKIAYTKNYSEKSNNPDIDLDTIVIKRHDVSKDKENEIERINNLKLNIQDKNIILITKIYNNFINKYFEIINLNETIKKIISSN